jgi:hypothetical protein
MDYGYIRIVGMDSADTGFATQKSASSSPDRDCGKVYHARPDFVGWKWIAVATDLQ